MKWKFVVPVIAVILFTSCDKNSFQTKPQIKVKSINRNVLPVGADLLINLEFTDKEGDIGKSDFIIIRNRINRRPISQPNINDKADTIRGKVPEFPKHSLGELQVALGYNSFLKEDPNLNDTLVFKFAVTDLGGNKSDTITSDIIVVLK